MHFYAAMYEASSVPYKDIITVCLPLFCFDLSQNKAESQKKALTGEKKARKKKPRESKAEGKVGKASVAIDYFVAIYKYTLLNKHTALFFSPHSFFCTMWLCVHSKTCHSLDAVFVSPPFVCFALPWEFHELFSSYIALLPFRINYNYFLSLFARRLNEREQLPSVGQNQNAGCSLSHTRRCTAIEYN